MIRRFLALMFVAGIQAAIVPAIQTSSVETPRFSYLLPEEFDGWACFDFGVDNAPPLNRDANGMYLLQPVKNAIVPTSSFPNLKQSPVPSEVTRLVNGQRQTVSLMGIQERGDYDTKRPVSRYCLFFGSADAARLVARPPTLDESRLGTAPLLRRFEFAVGSLCELREVPRVCLDATDVARRRIDRGIIEALPGHSITASQKCAGFDGILVEYRADWAAQTHTNARGPRYAFAAVRREQRGKGTSALATWTDTDGGDADAVAKRFARDLAELFHRAATATCPK